MRKYVIGASLPGRTMRYASAFDRQQSFARRQRDEYVRVTGRNPDAEPIGGWTHDASEQWNYSPRSRYGREYRERYMLLGRASHGQEFIAA